MIQHICDQCAAVIRVRVDVLPRTYGIPVQVRGKMTLISNVELCETCLRKISEALTPLLQRMVQLYEERNPEPKNA